MSSPPVVDCIARDEGPRLVLRGNLFDRGLGRADTVPSEIAVHPGWDVCYLANRTDNSLSIFSIEAGGAAIGFPP